MKKDETPLVQDRRAFMKAGGAATAALLAQGALPRPAQAMPELPSNRMTAGAMPMRNLGRTGFRVGIFSLGGQAALERGNNDAVAVPLVERALDLGVNYLDTSSIYGGPERWSERYIGQVMKRRRPRRSSPAKTKERTRDGSLRILETSLKLLNTDHIDLWQIHDLGTMERRRPDVRQGRRHGGDARGARAEAGALPRRDGPHRPESLIGRSAASRSTPS